MSKPLLLALALLAAAGATGVEGQPVSQSEDELVYQAIVGPGNSKMAARKALCDAKGWRSADDLGLLTFLDTSKPGLNAAVLLGERKYLRASQAETVAGLLAAIASDHFMPGPHYPYRHAFNDGGPKKMAMKILRKLRAVEALKKIIVMPLGDSIDSWIQLEFAVDCLVDLGGVEATPFFDSLQRNTTNPKNARIAGSMGVLRIAERDRTDKAAWRGVEFAKTHALSPIVQSQAQALLEGTGDPVRKVARDLSESMAQDRGSRGGPSRAQPRVMTPAELGEFFVEQMTAYRPINVGNGAVWADRLFAAPDTYDGKVVIFLNASLSLSSFGSAPYVVFTEPATGKAFNAYGVTKGSQAITFGEMFLVVGAWRKAPRQDDGARRVGMNVYRICGIVADQRARNAKVVCETPKTP